jgi:hypothetical protein
MRPLLASATGSEDETNGTHLLPGRCGSFVFVFDPPPYRADLAISLCVCAGAAAHHHRRTLPPHHLSLTTKRQQIRCEQPFSPQLPYRPPLPRSLGLSPFVSFPRTRPPSRQPRPSFAPIHVSEGSVASPSMEAAGSGKGSEVFVTGRGEPPSSHAAAPSPIGRCPPRRPAALTCAPSFAKGRLAWGEGSGWNEALSAGKMPLERKYAQKSGKVPFQHFVFVPSLPPARVPLPLPFLAPRSGIVAGDPSQSPTGVS